MVWNLISHLTDAVDVLAEFTGVDGRCTISQTRCVVRVVAHAVIRDDESTPHHLSQEQVRPPGTLSGFVPDKSEGTFETLLTSSFSVQVCRGK